MPAISRPQLAVYAAAAAAVLLIGARYLHDTRAQAPAPRAPAAVRIASSGGGSGWIVVQVAGAVRRPGVYRVRAGARADDAVRRAGGPRRDADLAGVNLAAKLEDGRQVIVPAAAPSGAGPVGGTAAAGPGPAAGGVTAATDGPVGGGVTAGGAVAAGPPLNLNTATAEQLDTLDGIGPVTAQKILAYRQAHGGFRSVAELGQVPGIGEKRMAVLRDRVTV